MDPLSITTACVGLIGTVAKTTLAVTIFTRECREARSDLTSINGELSQLQLVLELLRDDTAVSDDQILSESLQEQILSIIDNCSAVVSKINLVLDKHSGKVGVLKWAAFGKNEVVGLRMSLEAHRGSLNLALELVSVSLSKAIKSDTTAIRTDVHDIKQDTSQIPQIMDELTRLRAIVAGGDFPAATIGQNYVLQQYLDDLTSYAETVCNDVEWETNSSVHALSRSSSRSGPRDESSPPVIQLEPSADASSQVASLTTTRVYDEDENTCLQPTRSVSTGDTSQNTYQVRINCHNYRFYAKSSKVLLWKAKKNIVLVGDPACGKTALLSYGSLDRYYFLLNITLSPNYFMSRLCKGAFFKGAFYDVIVPTVFEEYAAHIDGIYFALRVASEDYDRIRPLSYRAIDVALICFAIDSPDSLENVKKTWISKVSNFMPNVPCILVGLKKDLRDDPKTIEELKKDNQQPGNDMAKDIGAFRYVECSAKTVEGVREVSEIAAVQKRPNSLRRMCKRLSSR
ncbi:unnamed protein product [Fusarium venenatum]|uniref:Azaphilone pigments biosynthesis cluster protein L N-terminal domain-containing protein n=1 Tax=Fusarium venenatum TaxID=56646 RepID=A0A2L2TDP3_9HYPO|nr:LOW QUALITY PROTEIN: uncharacterized protein FVRRES_08166 [Fusarium venenatum]CEI68089.1 unnamed protein product [Fusarium venenatum]